MSHQHALKRCVLSFRGQVQGVGFRMTTSRIAQEFNVAGWVRNEPDGTVLCHVEGRAAEIGLFIQQVRDRMSGYIVGVESTDSEATGEFSCFEVRYS